MTIRALLLASWCAMALPNCVAAQVAPPPMDRPPLPWLDYNTDDRGRQTFLSQECLAESGPDRDACEKTEFADHQRQIDEHDGRRSAPAISDWDASHKRAMLIEHAPDTYAKRIRENKTGLARVMTVINREKRIGRISGAVNLETLHSMGTMAEFLRERIEADYANYRRYGGKKPLSAL